MVYVIIIVTDSSQKDFNKIDPVNLIKSSQHSNESDDIMCGQKCLNPSPAYDFKSSFDDNEHIHKKKVKYFKVCFKN